MAFLKPILIICIINVNLYEFGKCLFEQCNHQLYILSGENLVINSPFYPKKYPSGSSCRYAIAAPLDQRINFKCTIDLDSLSTRCTTEIFYFNQEGSELLSASDYFCGSGTVERKSFLNLAVISYISSSNDNSSGGHFSCLIEVEQPSCDCGWSISPKVAAGVEAEINEFPSMAGVLHLVYNKIFCGATIIHHRFLLSAAHCFFSNKTENPDNLAVIVGDSDLANNYETYQTRMHKIEEIICHENFHTNRLQNDIALLKTKENILWDHGIGPACLPFRFETNEHLLAGSRLDVAGWGTTSFGGQQTSRLLKTTLDAIDNDECRTKVTDLTKGQFCTYTPGKDTCQYDSGGALYLRSTRLFAIGIVSYGFACATVTPSVNTRVTSYLQWIQNITNPIIYCVK